MPQYHPNSFVVLTRRLFVPNAGIWQDQKMMANQNRKEMTSTHFSCEQSIIENNLKEVKFWMLN